MRTKIMLLGDGRRLPLAADSHSASLLERLIYDKAAACDAHCRSLSGGPAIWRSNNRCNAPVALACASVLSDPLPPLACFGRLDEVPKLWACLEYGEIAICFGVSDNLGADAGCPAEPPQSTG
jgi:hypothetical protein